MVEKYRKSSKMVRTRSSETYMSNNPFDLRHHRRRRSVDLICSDQNDTNESETEGEAVKHRTRSQDRKVTIQVDREDYSPGRTSPRRPTRYTPRQSNTHQANIAHNTDKKPMRFRDTDDEVRRQNVDTPPSGRYSLRVKMRDVMRDKTAPQSSDASVIMETPTPTSARYSLRRRIKPETVAQQANTHTEPVDAAYTSKSRREMRELHRRHMTASSAPPCTRGRTYEPRRSGRTRKLMYDTFNTSLMAMMRNTDNEEEGGEHDDIQGGGAGDEPVMTKRKRKTIEVEPMPEEEMTNMYQRVKRPRIQVKRDMYGRPLQQEVEKAGSEAEEGGSGTTTDSEGEESSEEEEEEEEEQPKGYSLRLNKPRTQMLEINWDSERPRRARNFSVFHEATPPPTNRKSPPHKAYHKSPARKRKDFRRRRAAFHGSSSTSSSSSSGGDSGDDERQFEHRKKKSMAKSRQRCLPMNFVAEDLNSGILKDRARVGGSLADIDPMSLDRSVTFDSVGGLGKHVRALKEMVVFPLLYPEVFERFKIQPPRGVLFYGPPGTGKTLVARALANECSRGEKKVAFFMRKGADCLSKWVGESERQLRLLFDQAYQMRPSIVFFDEIDGLAPVRSSRQDQIHSSIVSTLLALMDGLDSRGEIVVIGATNRIDSIDPALRRPGRFDREFLFPLPPLDARRQILEIHTRQWEPKLSGHFLAELAEKCVGYCGADLRSLCTEAALQALRRRYPQIYGSEEKLQLDVFSINVSARDFHRGMQGIVPASQRSLVSPARALSHSVKPLLHAQLTAAIQLIGRKVPTALTEQSSQDAAEDGELASDSDDDCPEIFESPQRGKNRRRSSHLPEAANSGPFLDFTRHATNTPVTHRPRVLLAGSEGQGQSSHLGPALLHSLERMPVHLLDLPALFAVSAKTPEESCSQIVREARRSLPSVLYMPHLCQWWDVVSDACRATFLSLLQDTEPHAPLTLIATCHVPYMQLPSQVQDLFSINSGEVILMQNPTDTERHQYFADLLLNQACRAPSTNRKAAERVLETLPKAPPPEPRQLTSAENSRLRQQEEATMRELRLFLRDVLNKLARERKFAIFSKPVDAEEVPDYYDVIEKPMDMSTMLSKVDLQKYECVGEFMRDISLICTNALEYNPDKDPQGRIIRHRACAFKDTAEAIVTTELDADFEKLCKEIKESKKNRGVSSHQAAVPDYYFTRPISHSALDALQLDPQGLQVDGQATRRHTRSSPLTQDRGVVTHEPVTPVYEEINGRKYRKVVRRKFIRKKNMDKPKPQSPFCRNSKRKMRNVVYYVDNEGNEFTKGELLGDTGEGKEEKEEEITGETGDMETEEPGTGETEIKRVAVTEALTIETGSVEEQEAEKENDPHCGLSPTRGRAGRTRSFSPKGSGEGHSLSPQMTRSPRTRSPRTRSPRSNSPRVHSPNTHSPRGAGRLGGQGHVKFAEDEKEKESVEIGRDGEVTAGRKSHTTQSLCETQDTNSESSPVKLQAPSSPDKNAACVCVSTETGQVTGAPPGGANSPEKVTTSCTKASPEKSEEEQMEQEEGEASSSPIIHPRTRSQTNNKQVHKAMEIIERATPSLVIDTHRLRGILGKTVEKTRGYNIERLERLYSVLSQCVYHHRREYDKSQLVQELEATVEHL